MYLAVGTVCIGTAAGGAWAMYRELQPMSLGATSLDRVLANSDVSALPGLSIASQNQALLDCYNTLQSMQSLLMMYRTAEERDAVAPRCLAMADYLAQRNPSFAYTWYIGALASAYLNDWDGFNERLALSFRTGATEQWIGELRVALAEDNYDHLDEITLAANDADLHMLVLSSRGVHAIAQRYVSNPEFRERITVIVEAMPAQNQTRFIADVRRFANNRGRGRS